jgi:hypothetical protein
VYVPHGPAKFHDANLRLDPVTRRSVATRAADATHVPHLPLRPALDGTNRPVRSLPFGRERRLELLDVGLQRGVVGLKHKDQRGANDIGIGHPF